MGRQVIGLGTFRQKAGGWENENYTFGNVSGTFDHLGCTPTSITNILVWTARRLHEVPPTPSNTNRKDSIFWKFFGKTTFTDLTGNNNQLKGDLFNRVRIDLLKTPIEQNSAAGKDLKNSIKISIGRGKPVLLGIRGNNNPRHSIVAAGIDDYGNILVIDPWTTITQLDDNPNNDDDRNTVASYAPVGVINVKVGSENKPYNKFDMAYEATRHSYMSNPSRDVSNPD
jgi:hypothetical protein